MWCWRRTEISWAERVGNEEVLLRVKGERNILHTVNGRILTGFCHILHRNHCLKHVEGERAVIRGRRRKQLLDDNK